MKPLKLAHRDGQTDVCYDSSGSFIITGGSDGKVCIWEGRDDTDTTTVSVGEKVYAIAFQGGRFFAATDENSIRIHTFPDGVSDGLVTRFTSPCRCFHISMDGSLVVAGADDFKIKVISMEENECICLYSDHQAPILSVAADPNKEFVASASCDGTIKIWGLYDGTTEKSMELLSKCSEPMQAKSLCQMCWSQDGEFLMIPVSNEVYIVLRSSWEVVRKVGHHDIPETINTMKLSPDGAHLAFGCVNGDMGILNWQAMKLIDKHSHPKRVPITSIAWNPHKLNEVAFCDNVGQLGFLDTVLGTNQDETTGNNTADDVDDDMHVTAEGSDLDAINKFLDDGDDENSIDIGSIKRSLLPVEDNDDSASVASAKVDEVRPAQPAVAAPSLPPPQSAFQPGSTPVHLSSRFMVWNSVGIIRQYVSEDENSIDVEFHDTSTHHALHIDNKSDYVMGDLSSQAVLLASQAVESLPSKLLCMHFGSWDNHKEWAYEMPEGEEIQAITVSDRWAAVATSSRNLRVFSIGGLQRQVISLPGDVVTLASQGHRLLVIFHRGMGLTAGDQCMGIHLMSVGRRSAVRMLINGEALPLSLASKLAWAGFSEEGGVFYMDVEGIIRTRDGQCWTPVANLRQHAKGKSDHYWLVSISSRQHQIRCVPCKGSRFPATLPRPALAVLPLQIPLCDIDSEKSKYEDAYLRNSLLSRSHPDQEDLEKPVREALVKLFAFAAKSERDYRALEVCELMPDQSLLQIAATYAMRLRRMQLAERVNEYMHSRQEGEEDDGDEADEDIGPADEEDLGESQVSSVGQSLSKEDSDEDGEDSQIRETSGPQLITKVDKGAKSTERPSGRFNPFKVSGSSERKAVKGSQIFDKMEKTTPKAAPVFAPLPVSINKSGKKMGQSKLMSFKKEKESSPRVADVKESSPGSADVKLESSTQEMESSENQPVPKKASAFDLWLEANKEQVRKAHPDQAEEDLAQVATEDFRALSKEERQTWVQKAKAAQACNAGDSTKKRKIPTEETEQLNGGKAPTEDNKKLKREPESARKAPLSQTTNAKLARFAKTN